MTDKLPNGGIEFGKELAAIFVIDGGNGKLRRINLRQAKVGDTVIRVSENEVIYGVVTQEPCQVESGRWWVAMETYEAVDDREKTP